MENGSRTKSGVFLFGHFRDNLIIDKYDPILNSMRSKKIEHLRSENSEDAITWNVFRTLRQINPALWFTHLISSAFQYDIRDIQKPNLVNIKLWESKIPPTTFPGTEGRSEVDIIIETESLVWFIEAKYKSDISQSTINDATRDQVIRNIDVGTSYARDRKFYFSLLILDEKYTSIGVELLKKYQSSIDNVLPLLPHRSNDLDNLANLSLIKWSDMAALLLFLSLSAENEYERYYAENAYLWLKRKGIE